MTTASLANHLLARKRPRFASQPWLEGYRVLWFCIVLLLLLTGCSRAPDIATVHEVVSSRLQSTFSEPVLEINTMKRLGSAPLSAGREGEPRLIVYYNASFTLARDYQFSDWDAVNPAALANLLGATEFGIVGIDSHGNSAGDTLLVRGSVTFRQDAANEWIPAPFVPSISSVAASASNDVSATTQAVVQSIMRRFAAVPSAHTTASQAIIIDELEQAVRQIDLRLDNLQQVLVLAGGPAGGEYDLIAKVIADFHQARGDKVGVTVTDGSVRNAQLVRDHVANIALVQNDVALMAYQGREPFAKDPASSLRALGSLFPEPVQVVVREDGPNSIDDLRDKRVDLGALGSGSRATALRVLEAHGLSEADVQSSGLGPAAAGDALVAGEIDAFFTVIHAPARHLQRLAADHAIRILSMSPQAVDTLTKNDAALVPITLPTGIYPGQSTAVRTVAVAALLVGTSDLSNAEVRSLLQTVYTDIDFVAAGSSAGAMISPQRARTGITIPMHPAADEYFGE